MAHPLYSPDISPSDFCLFRKVKSELIEQEIPNEMYLLEAVVEILNNISDAGVQHVFGSWLERVERELTPERIP
jgi:hypothetical protein